MPPKATQQGAEHSWAAVYRDWYDSKTAAEFARVNPGTLYYSLRHGHLIPDPDYTKALGKPIITHAALTAWMTDRGLVVPAPLKHQDHIRDQLTVKGAARIVRLSAVHVQAAIDSGRLQEVVPGRVERRAVTSWAKAGALIASPDVPRYFYRNRVGEFMHAHGFTAAMTAAQCGNALGSHEIARLMQDTSEANLGLIAALAGMLEHLTGRVIPLSDLLTLERS